MAPWVLYPPSEMRALQARGCPRCGERRRATRRDRRRCHGSKPSQRGKRLRTRFLHDRSAVVLDRAPADSKVCGDVLAGVAVQNQIQNLVLSRCQTRTANCECPLTRRRACGLCSSVRNGRRSFAELGLSPGQGNSEPGFFLPVYRKLMFEARDCAIDVESVHGIRTHASIGHG